LINQNKTVESLITSGDDNRVGVDIDVRYLDLDAKEDPNLGFN